MARRGDLLAIKGAWQLCRYLLQVSETEELQQIEHDLREKLFLLYITSEFEGDIDFVLLKSLLLENDRLQYGLIVVITWLALLRSIVSTAPQPQTPANTTCRTRTMVAVRFACLRKCLASLMSQCNSTKCALRVSLNHRSNRSQSNNISGKIYGRICGHRGYGRGF